MHACAGGAADRNVALESWIAGLWAGGGNPVELPQLLRDAGYSTAGIGKMHWSPQRARHGFNQTILDESGREESPEFRSDYRSWFWSESPLGNPDATGLDWNGYEAQPFALAGHLHPTAWISERGG